MAMERLARTVLGLFEESRNLGGDGLTLEPKYHAVVEVIAAMKSNRGSIQQWIKELEAALNIEEISVIER